MLLLGDATRDEEFDRAMHAHRAPNIFAGRREEDQP